MTDRAARGPLSEPTTYNLLFVCTGNTCRSPMAMGIARRLLAERGWTHVAVQSAGIAAAAGAPASAEAVRVAAERGVDLSGHGSQMLTPALVDWADMILVMGPSHLDIVADLGGEEKAAVVTEFVDGDGGGEPIDDPFGAEEAAYRQAFAQLERAVAGLLARLEPILSP